MYFLNVYYIIVELVNALYIPFVYYSREYPIARLRIFFNVLFFFVFLRASPVRRCSKQ